MLPQDWWWRSTQRLLLGAGMVRGQGEGIKESPLPPETTWPSGLDQFSLLRFWIGLGWEGRVLGVPEALCTADAGSWHLGP